MNNWKHATCNLRIGAPPGWNDRLGQLQLPTIDATQGSLPGTNHKVFVTWWEPTKEELAILLAGGKVQLACIGGQPPVSVIATPESGAGLILQAPPTMM